MNCVQKMCEISWWLFQNKLLTQWSYDMFPDRHVRGPESCKTFIMNCYTSIVVLHSATHTEVHGSFCIKRLYRSFIYFLWLALLLFVCNIMDSGISASIEKNWHALLKCQCKKLLTLHSWDFFPEGIYWILSEGSFSNSLSKWYLTIQFSDFYFIIKLFEN